MAAGRPVAAGSAATGERAARRGPHPDVSSANALVHQPTSRRGADGMPPVQTPGVVSSSPAVGSRIRYAVRFAYCRSS